MISILMPIYNGIEFIKQSVNSIKNQTYKDWELIIGINGHNPNSEVYNKAKEYENEQIKVIELHPIKGKSAALNIGFSKAKGDVVITMDADLQDSPDEIPDLYNTIIIMLTCLSSFKIFCT